MSAAYSIASIAILVSSIFFSQPRLARTHANALALERVNILFTNICFCDASTNHPRRPLARLFLLRCTTRSPLLPLAGHYNKRTDALRISVDKHTDAALNKRTALEQLVELVNTVR